MRAKRPPGLFITGVSTEVGKTYVTSLIAKWLTAKGQRVGVYKPLASGLRRDGDRLICDDAVALWESAGKPGELSEVCPQCFQAPLAPHLAARAEGKEVDAQLLREGIQLWRDRCDVVLVEGAGGLMSPVGDEEYVADLAADFGYPLLVVAANRLGVINQTLQTLIVAATFRDGLEIAGVVLNDTQPAEAADASAASNLAELRSRCAPPVLAHVGWRDETIGEDVDWLALAAN